MPANDGKKVRLRAAAITALMTCSTLTAAAEKSGVSESTLMRWMRDPAFAAELDAAQTDVIAQTARNLAALSPGSVAAIAAALSPKEPTAVRLSGARLQLDAVIRFAELMQFSRRLENLEAALQAAQEAGPAGATNYRIVRHNDPYEDGE